MHGLPYVGACLGHLQHGWEGTWSRQNKAKRSVQGSLRLTPIKERRNVIMTQTHNSNIAVQRLNSLNNRVSLHAAKTGVQ